MTERHFLDESKTLVDAVAEWLLTKARRTPCGVASLDHLLVLTPTRQAGRRLRFALAERFAPTGCVPPCVTMPLHLLTPKKSSLQIASQTESLAILIQVLQKIDIKAYPVLFPKPCKQTSVWAAAVASQLLDVWSSLAENAMTMGDVANKIDGILDDDSLALEIDRWRDMASIEAIFFSTMKKAGRLPDTLARREAIADPMIPASVEEIVLPGLTDPIPALYDALRGLNLPIHTLIHAQESMADMFDEWGRPDPERWEHDPPALNLVDNQIIVNSTIAEEAAAVAEYFASIPKNMALPALGLIDDNAFQELRGAFIGKEIELHNPARCPVANSSLGHLVRLILNLVREPEYSILSAFMRSLDVQRWLTAECELSDAEFADALYELDVLQNEILPRTLEDIKSHARHESFLKKCIEKIENILTETDASDGLCACRRILERIFKTRTIDEIKPEDREFAASATAVATLFDAFESELIPREIAFQLFETQFANTTYLLEPKSSDDLLTEGWLELPWTPNSEIALVGCVEGALPEAIVGHAFLPDQLRAALGLETNARRTARDMFIMHELLACRNPAAVRFFLHRIDADGTAAKPSRLLFLESDDTTLVKRAERLFCESSQKAQTPKRALPDAWRLSLPVPQDTKIADKLSVSSIDAYLSCPFSFYLSHVLRLETVNDRAKELDMMRFGIFCHGALKSFADSQLRDSDDAIVIAQFLKTSIYRQFAQVFGDRLPTVLHLQRDAASKRLEFFAVKQAQRRREGWKIVSTEKQFEININGTVINGIVDRIDVNERTGAMSVIDYKTWDSDKRCECVSTNRKVVEFTKERGLPVIRNFDVESVWTHLQLPLYLSMIQANGLSAGMQHLSAEYCVLGKTIGDTCFCDSEAVTTDMLQSADAMVRALLTRLRRGIFWPPSPEEKWKRDFSELFFDSPKLSVVETWIQDQEKRNAR